MFNKIRKTYNPGLDKVPPIRLAKWRRDVLIANLGACGFTRGAELGVREGLGALKMCQMMPGLHLILVDPWDVWPGHKDMDGHADDPLLFLEEAQERLRGYDCEFIRAKSADYASNVPDASLDFVYIDGDHSFDGTMLDLILWAPKVRVGGVISGDGYKHYRYTGVIPAVDTYTRQHLVHEWYITGEMDSTYFWRKNG